MRLLVVLSAVVLAALARPGYPGAAGIAGLPGNGIGIVAPAYTARLSGLDGVPSHSPAVTADAGHAQVVAQMQTRDAPPDDEDLRFVHDNYYRGVGFGIGGSIGHGYGFEHTGTMGLFRYDPSNIQLVPGSIVDTPL